MHTKINKERYKQYITGANTRKRMQQKQEISNVNTEC